MLRTFENGNVNRKPTLRGSLERTTVQKVTWLTRGAISLSNSRSFASMLGAKIVKPVKLPPGCLRASHETLGKWVATADEYDGYRAGLLLHRVHRRTVRCCDGFRTPVTRLSARGRVRAPGIRNR